MPSINHSNFMAKAQTILAAPDGLQRFRMPLDTLGGLVLKSRKSKNPALFLFENGTRNYLFRLEALCRIYRKIGSKKLFDPLYEEFKSFEDQLGKIDYYDAFYKEFSSVKKIPVSFLRYFSSHRDMELSRLNESIKSGNLFTGDGRINEIRNMLTDVNWMERAPERKSIALFITEQIDRFLSQYRDGELNFHDMESGVHEFRRKLRWISIYAQSLNGLIQLKKLLTKLGN